MKTMGGNRVKVQVLLAASQEYQGFMSPFFALPHMCLSYLKKVINLSAISF